MLRETIEEIYIMKADGSDVRQLTDNGAQNWSPTWNPLGATSSQSNTWVKTFEDYGNAAFFDMILNDDGDILVVGATDYTHAPPFSGDALFMKLNLQGDLLWESSWGGDGYDHAWAVAPAEDDGYYVFGETDSHGAGDRDFFLLKMTDDGKVDWFQTYGGEHREWPYGMLQLSNGDLLLYGFTASLSGRARYQYALRVRPDGEVIWEYIGEGSEDEKVTDAVEIPGGELVLAVVAEEDGKLVKLDANGNVLWAKRYELDDWQFAAQVIQTASGGFLLAGSRSVGYHADTWLAYSTSTGELEWETSIGDSTANDFGQSLIRLNDGTYLIGGRGNGMLLSRIDENGDLLWRRSLLGSGVYGASALIELEDGGYLVAGFIEIINGVSCDAILLRTDADGRVGE
jgi:hypothetical protein